MASALERGGGRACGGKLHAMLLEESPDRLATQARQTVPPEDGAQGLVR